MAFAESCVEVLTLHSRVENVVQSSVQEIYCDTEYVNFYAKQAADSCTVADCEAIYYTSQM